MGITRIDRTSSRDHDGAVGPTRRLPELQARIRTRPGDQPLVEERLAAVLDVPVADVTVAPRQLRAEIAPAADPALTV